MTAELYQHEFMRNEIYNIISSRQPLFKDITFQADAQQR